MEGSRKTVRDEQSCDIEIIILKTLIGEFYQSLMISFALMTQSTEQEQNCESSSSELASASESGSALRSSTAGSASAFKRVLSSASRLNSLKDCASQTDVGINPKPSAEEQSGEEQIAKEINDEEQKNIESQIDFNENQNNNDRSRGRSGNRDRSTSERRYESQGRCQESQWRDEKGTTEEQHHTL